MPRARRPLLLTLALASSLGLAACGSDLSKAQYIAKVDPICAKYTDQSKTIKEPTENNPAVVANYLTQLADLADKQTNEIDKVGRPKDGKAQIDDLLKRQRNQIAQLRQAADAYRGGDAAKANQIANAAQPEGTKIDSDLKAFGLTKCGGDS